MCEYFKHEIFIVHKSVLGLDVFHIRSGHESISPRHMVCLQQQRRQLRHRHHVPRLEHEFPVAINLRTRVTGQVV